MRALWVTAMLVVLPVMAGCLGGETGGVSDADGPPDDELAAVRGLVTSDELFPVVGADVELESYPPTQTDDEGVFEIRGVAAGTYELRVNATGFEPATQQVDVPPRGVVQLRVELVGIPGEAPFMELFIFDGYEVCGVALVYSAFSFEPCPSSQPRETVHTVEVQPEWRHSVQELDWETQDEMIFASSHYAGCVTSDPCAALLWGPAPLRIDASPEDPEYAAKYALDGEKTFPEGNFTNVILSSYNGLYRSEINETLNPVCVQINRQFNVPDRFGCPFGVGVSLGIRLTYYHATFYHALPLNVESYTSLPDE